MKIPLTLIIMAIGLMALSAVGTTVMDREESSIEVAEYQPCYSSDRLDMVVDPLPMSVLPEKKKVNLDPFPTEKHLRAIGRMAESIHHSKMKMGGWWECGVFYTDDKEVMEKALMYAHMIVKEAWEASDPPYVKDGWTLNPWGLAGTIHNESKFDRCALGLYPRKKAYELGIIKKNRLTLSHTEEDVIAAVTDPRMQEYFKKSGFDMGVAQLLSRFYESPNDYENMLSLKGGTEEAARTMRDRARLYRTDRPWKYWPGHKADWYDDKVTRWAKGLGATKGEI